MQQAFQPFKGTRIRRIQANQTVCVYRGRPSDSDLLIGGGRGKPSDKPNRLILPGQERRGGGQQQQQLFVPDDREARQPAGPGLVDLVGAAPAPTYNKFRPPAKFMEDVFKDEEVDLDPEEMMSRLRSRSGYWHDLAKYLTPLNKAGYDGGTIDAIAGITPREQSMWLVANTLYESLKECDVTGEVLTHFDRNGDELLYPFRFLEKDRRAEAAKYIHENDLTVEECEVLARAMKEWERRPFERVGFSDLPADCLAFKYLRDAGEVKKIVQIEDKVKQGLAVAVSETAMQRLREWLEDAKSEGDTGEDGTLVQRRSTANLLSLRLEFEEMGFRPIPLVGEFGQVTAAQIEDAPKATTRGPFGAFVFPPNSADTLTWVALPQWKAVAMARNPAGLSVTECTNIPAVLSNINHKNKDDLKRVGGPGMLVVDKWQGVAPRAITKTKFYIVGGERGPARMVDGGSIDGASVVGEVLFLCRPPIRENTLESTGSDLLTL